MRAIERLQQNIFRDHDDYRFDSFSSKGFFVQILKNSSLIEFDSQGNPYYVDPNINVAHVGFEPYELDIAEPDKAFDILTIGATCIEKFIKEVNRGKIIKPDILVGLTNPLTARLSRKLGFIDQTDLAIQATINLDLACEDESKVEEILESYSRPGRIINLVNEQIDNPVPIDIFTIKTHLAFEKIAKTSANPVETSFLLYQIIYSEFFDPEEGLMFDMDLNLDNLIEIHETVYVILGLNFLFEDKRYVRCNWEDFVANFEKLKNSPVGKRIRKNH